MRLLVKTNLLAALGLVLTAAPLPADSAETAFIAGLNGGQTYGNVHTTLNPGGEIRGQLAAIPEPASILLAGSFLLFFALFRRKIV